MTDFLGRWFIPIFSIMSLLVSYYRAADKPNWLKTNAKTFAIVLAFIAPMGVVGVAAFFFG